MANVTATNPIIGDTVGTLISGQSRCHTIIYSGGTTAGHMAILTDKKGNIVCKLTSAGNGDTVVANFMRDLTSDGLVLSAISSGTVYIYQ